MHELKIYREVVCNDIEEWWKIWRGIDHLFQNSHKEFEKFQGRIQRFWKWGEGASYWPPWFSEEENLRFQDSLKKAKQRQEL